jgi:pimeloyl-ACP methyl ester carboxylesterase
VSATTASRTGFGELLRRWRTARGFSQLHGDTDASAPVEITGAKAVALIPGARLKIYQNAPHALLATHLPQVEADILEFTAAAAGAQPAAAGRPG